MFHPSHRLFSRLENNSTVSLTIPLDSIFLVLISSVPGSRQIKGLTEYGLFEIPQCDSSSLRNRFIPCDRSIFRPLWFVGNKIKKPMILCARNTSRSRNTDHAARTCEWFVYSIVKITRFYDYQTDAFFWEIHEMRKGLWAFFLTMIFECWLAEQVNSDHMVWRMFKATVIMPPRLVCWLILWTTVNLIRCLRRPQKKKMKNA